MKILVTGAGGLNGSLVVQKLSARGVPVRALVRRPNPKLAALPNVEVVEGDLLRPETLPLDGIERALLISSSTPDMLEAQSTFIEAARGLKHVVKLSGILPERDSPFRFARMHGEIEARLEASGVPFTHLRAGEFMHSYFRQVKSIARGVLALPMEDARIASVDVDDLAEVAANVLTSTGHEGKIYRLTGPEALTMTEVAARLSTALGKPIDYLNVTPEDARRAHLDAGFAPYLADALFELFAERRRGKESQVFPDTSTLLGRPATSFAQFVERHAAVFLG